MNDSAEAFEAQRRRLFGESALLAWTAGVLFAAFVPEIAGGRIAAVRVLANPDKLAFAARQAACHVPPTCPVFYF